MEDPLNKTMALPPATISPARTWTGTRVAPAWEDVGWAKWYLAEDWPCHPPGDLLPVAREPLPLLLIR